MSSYKGPRIGSLAHHVLLELLKHGGACNESVLFRTLGGGRARKDFDENVIGSLVRQGLAATNGEGIGLTPRGRLFIDPPSQDTDAPVPVVLGRYVAPIRPLSIANRPKPPMRPGALDYRDIPSRMADALVDHVVKAAA